LIPAIDAIVAVGAKLKTQLKARRKPAGK